MARYTTIGDLVKQGKAEEVTAPQPSLDLCDLVKSGLRMLNVSIPADVETWLQELAREVYEWRTGVMLNSGAELNRYFCIENRHNIYELRRCGETSHHRRLRQALRHDALITEFNASLQQIEKIK